MKNIFLGKKSTAFALFITTTFALCSLSEEAVEIISGLSGAGVCVATGIATGYCLQDPNISNRNLFIASGIVGVGVGTFAWWMIRGKLMEMTPFYRYQFILSCKKNLDADMLDKRVRYSQSTVYRVQEMRSIVNGVMHEISGDLSFSGLFESCKKLYAELIALEKKLSLKINYLQAVEDINRVACDALVKKCRSTSDASMLLVHAQVCFRTNWPLVEARSSLENSFSIVEKAQESLIKISADSSLSKKRINLCSCYISDAQELIELIEICMDRLLGNPEYHQQKMLKEADRVRKEKEAARAREAAREHKHQQELLSQRQKHDREILEAEALERRYQEERAALERERERRMKREVLNGAQAPIVHAEVRI